MNELPKLTDKEEEVMGYFWDESPLTIRQVVERFPEPKPHFNTISTFVTFLEKKGYLRREKKGVSSYFTPTVPKEQYGTRSIKSVMHRFFNNSCMSVVASLVKEENISVSELKELIEMVEKQETKE